ncbi:MAG: phosphoenolpyruvate synthase [Lachnospiraceae bacterium]|nr:phosphoenolpyruvate synthase [Lachnospiraceae bacterium]
MIKFGTKAETLERLAGKCTQASVLPLTYFSVGEWRSSPLTVWEEVSDAMNADEWIVRSSAIGEDTAESSQAGRFESVGNVRGREAFYDAVQSVIASFGDDNLNNQVLVQPMLRNVGLCGVAFTADPNTLGNYYVINYDRTGSTSSVTSGTGKGSSLLYVFKGHPYSGDERIGRLCRALAELEGLFGEDNLDVEFAVTEDGGLYILQVRMLCLDAPLADYGSQQEELRRIEEKITRSQSPKPFLCGKKTIYGVMTDWNPAEMIGIRPKPLAMSLYQEIITDSVWAYQRDNYGYQNLRSFPLMVDFCGLPYIDIRVSFNSFIPAGLEETISEKLVDYYMGRLTEDPTKHDKVEFDIVFSCYTLDLPQRIKVLAEYGFTEDEIRQIVNALRDVTNRIINHKTGLWRKDYEKIGFLEKRYDEIMGSDMGDVEKIYWLLEDCKRYGTLPFAGLARAAFIAVQMLQSMVTVGIITTEEYQWFMNDVNTVSSSMGRDFTELTKKQFLEKYGHLRPGTYDINSKRYDEAPETYFKWKESLEETGREEEKENGHFKLSLGQMHGLADALQKNGLSDDILELMDFIKSVIEGREYGKFIFTKNLSRAIQMIGELGELYGISKEDCAYIDVRAVQGLYKTTVDIGETLRNGMNFGKKNYRMTKTLVLPPIILESSDVWQFYYPDSEPNYITLGYARGDAVILEGEEAETDIEGKIILVPSADPGYDWIFSHGIKGFITAYGGANSHMAIRAGELGIPAVIGVGEKQFEQYKNAAVLEIDCLAKDVRIIR